MKRTRRVEVVRYTSWVTEIQGESAAPVMADEQPAGDLVLDLLGHLAPMPEPENCNQVTACYGGSDHQPRRRSFFGLGKLLRQRR